LHRRAAVWVCQSSKRSWRAMVVMSARRAPRASGPSFGLTCQPNPEWHKGSCC